MSKRFLSSNEISTPQINDYIPLPKDIEHHLLHVSRIKNNDLIELLTPNGLCITARFLIAKNITPQLQVISFEKLQSQNTISIHAYVPLFKWNRFDWMIEKLAELNLNEITPIITQRTLIKISPEQWIQKKQRLDNILIQATRQSLSNSIPSLHQPLAFKEAIDNIPPNTLTLIADPTSTKSIKDIDLKNHQNIIFITGPEGGFDKREYQYALENKLLPIKLTNTVLRAETAPIVITSFLNLILF